jgi:hypothetical protein
MSATPHTASLFARPTRLAERSPWDFLTTLLAAHTGVAQRTAPPRRRSAKAGGPSDEGPAACGWFDSSQDLLQGLSVVESFPARAFEAVREPVRVPSAMHAAQRGQAH